MKIDGNQIKVGNILEINSKLWKVLKTQHTQPGKGGAYLQVEMKELKNGTKMNERFRSSESVERAILEEKTCQYLYQNKLVLKDESHLIKQSKSIVKIPETLLVEEIDCIINAIDMSKKYEHPLQCTMEKN